MLVQRIENIDWQQWKLLENVASNRSWWQSVECYEWMLSTQELKPFGVGIVQGEELRAVIIGYTTQASTKFKQWCTARTIINAGPMWVNDIVTEEIIALLKGANEQLQECGCIYAETRNFNNYGKWQSIFEQADWIYTPHYDVWIDLSHKLEEHLHENQVRKLHKAVESGQTWREVRYTDTDTKVEKEEKEEIFAKWYGQLTYLYKTKVRRPLLSKEALQAAWKQGVVLLIAEKGEQLLGGVLIHISGKTAYEWYICGPTIVTWGMMQWCKEMGLERLDMMGAGEPHIEYGVRKFKLQMGGDLQQFGRFRKVLSLWRYKAGVWGLHLRSLIHTTFPS